MAKETQENEFASRQEHEPKFLKIKPTHWDKDGVLLPYAVEELRRVYFGKACVESLRWDVPEISLEELDEDELLEYRVYQRQFTESALKLAEAILLNKVDVFMLHNLKPKKNKNVPDEYFRNSAVETVFYEGFIEVHSVKEAENIFEKYWVYVNKSDFRRLLFLYGDTNEKDLDLNEVQISGRPFKLRDVYVSEYKRRQEENELDYNESLASHARSLLLWLKDAHAHETDFPSVRTIEDNIRDIYKKCCSK